MIHEDEYLELLDNLTHQAGPVRMGVREMMEPIDELHEPAEGHSPAPRQGLPQCERDVECDGLGQQDDWSPLVVIHVLDWW